MNIADATTFDRVYREHRQTVFHAALRITKDAPQADDVVHDVFVRLWRRPDRFDASRGELASYLRLMARSRALDLWRERQAAGRAHDRLTAVVERAEPMQADEPAGAAIADERAVTVRSALRELPEAQREAVVLAYWGGLTAEEISRRVDVPLGTVKSRIRLGLVKMRGLVADTLPEPEFA
ncbi:MAG: sigma-70 family RNA polymerase sigma factor [Solirubrobacteraceae bacterium]|nr:sigma-70 family RNA polymerase sigma factor [Patulibacter sp.]